MRYQQNIKLNIVHSSHVNPKISFWFCSFENFFCRFNFSSSSPTWLMTIISSSSMLFFNFQLRELKYWRVRMNAFLRESQSRNARVESKLLWIFFQLLFPWQKPKPLLKVPRTHCDSGILYGKFEFKIVKIYSNIIHKFLLFSHNSYSDEFTREKACFHSLCLLTADTPYKLFRTRASKLFHHGSVGCFSPTNKKTT